MVRHVQPKDAKLICEIYNYHVSHTIVTFEEEPITEREMQKRIIAITSKFPWLVYELNNEPVGYAYATSWRARSAYRYSSETTVYIKQEHTGKGIGKALYDHLIYNMKQGPCHFLIGGISLPNEASVALHEKLDFKKIAHFKEVGFKLNQWIDVGYWQLILNNQPFL
jgi:phosphinothricin acetyltransferase